MDFKYWKTVFSEIGALTMGILSYMIIDKYVGISIVVIGSAISYYFAITAYNKDKEKQKIIDRFIELKNKYGTELDGLDTPNYFGYITTEFNYKEIEFLIKQNLINKSDYETRERLSNLIRP